MLFCVLILLMLHMASALKNVVVVGGSYVGIVRLESQKTMQ